VRAKNKMLSLAALLTNTLLFIFLDRIIHVYNIFVCVTTRASEKRRKKVSRNAELTDYAKSSASAITNYFLSVCMRRNARRITKRAKKCTPNAGAIALAFETSFTLFHHRRAR
jgi:hypothetical protein